MSLRNTSTTHDAPMVRTSSDSGTQHQIDDYGTSRMSDLYLLTPTVLATGTQGVICEAMEIASRTMVACKIVELPKVADNLPGVRQIEELEVLGVLGAGHPALLAVKHAFVERGQLFMFMDKMAGDLCDAVLSEKSFSEDKVKIFFRHFLEGVQFMHERGVIHRDIKLDNIFLEDVSELCSARLGDFGLSIIKKSQGRDSCCGSKEYMAPELVNQYYSKPFEVTYDSQVDMWSAGVVLYCLLSKEFPFPCSRVPELFEAISTADFEFDSPVWRRLSSHVQDLIRKLLVVDPSQRLTAKQALQHRWFDSLPKHHVRQEAARNRKECQDWKKLALLTRPVSRKEMLGVFWPRIQELIDSLTPASARPLPIRETDTESPVPSNINSARHGKQSAFHRDLRVLTI